MDVAKTIVDAMKHRLSIAAAKVLLLLQLTVKAVDAVVKPLQLKHLSVTTCPIAVAAAANAMVAVAMFKPLVFKTADCWAN